MDTNFNQSDTVKKTTIYLPLDLFDELERIAHKERRSLTQQIVYMLLHGRTVDDERQRGLPLR